jgi:hypothetical protein
MMRLRPCASQELGNNRCTKANRNITYQEKMIDKEGFVPYPENIFKIWLIFQVKNELND